MIKFIIQSNAILMLSLQIMMLKTCLPPVGYIFFRAHSKFFYEAFIKIRMTVKPYFKGYLADRHAPIQ